jgi:hypothetical protein
VESGIGFFCPFVAFEAVIVVELLHNGSEGTNFLLEVWDIFGVKVSESYEARDIADHCGSSPID